MEVLDATAGIGRRCLGHVTCASANHMQRSLMFDIALLYFENTFKIIIYLNSAWSYSKI